MSMMVGGSAKNMQVPLDQLEALNLEYLILFSKDNLTAEWSACLWYSFGQFIYFDNY